MSRSSSWLALLFATRVLLAQTAPLERLAAESTQLRAFSPIAKADDPSFPDEFKRNKWTPVETALRDWIESRLPANRTELDRALPQLNSQLTADLWRAGLFEPEKPVAFAGYVSDLTISRPAEDANLLIVRTAMTVPCGADDSFYLYRYSSAGWTRLLESANTGDIGNYLLDLQVSLPGSSGSRLVSAMWDGASCASVWNGLGYHVYRINPSWDRAVPVFSGDHEMVIDEDLNVKLDPAELLLEFASGALEPGFRRRTVLHYAIGAEGGQRLDPVALQPQDFVHEWLISPWDDMKSRSAGDLAKWHKFLHDISGEYEIVQPCSDRADFTQVGVLIESIGDRESPEPLSVYFMVRDHGGHRYEMSEIGYDRQEGCPGETQADLEHSPSLFNKK
jgi:hypothetical protein